MAETLTVSDFHNLRRVKTTSSPKKKGGRPKPTEGYPHKRRSASSFEFQYGHWDKKFNWDELLDGECRFISDDEGGNYPSLEPVAFLNAVARGMSVVTKRVTRDGRKGTVIQATKLEERTNGG